MAVESCGDFHALPEDCIANALSLTTPKDVCRLSAVASAFRSASESDTVWERFLPTDYRDLLSRAGGGGGGSDSLLDLFRSKKDLYLYLCDHPVVIDGGRKSFTLDKLSGKKCFTLSARALSIVWGDTPEYWKWISLPESRFSEVAELIDVCWFEIRTKISTIMLSPNTNYAAYLVFKAMPRMYGFEHTPAEGSMTVNGEEIEKRSLCLDPEGQRRQQYQIVPRSMVYFYHRLPRIQTHLRYHHNNDNDDDDVNNDHDNDVDNNNDDNNGNGGTMDEKTEYPRIREDGWMEVEIGEYFVNGEDEEELEVSLMEVKGANWKRGIIVEGIEIRPKIKNKD